MNNQPPLSMKKQIQILLILTFLAWATQTLLAQLGFGQTVEVRPEATVYGGEVTLRQVARWSDADATKAAPIADLVIARFDGSGTSRTVTVDDIQRTLEDAGANLATVRFVGPFSCTVARADAPLTEAAALASWSSDAMAGAGGPRADVAPTPPGSLRQFLIDDLAVRIGIPADQLQIAFNPKDEKTLALSQPQFKFNVIPRRTRNLGPVNWEVQISSAGGISKANITATARAWQDQVIVAKPLANNQVIRADDVQARRALVDQLPDDKTLTTEQVVGQQATRDMKVGALVTAKCVQSVPLVRAGQTVTVTVRQGALQITAAAKALEGGTYGQSIKVRNESTKQIYDAVVSGPQTAVVGSL